MEVGRAIRILRETNNIKLADLASASELSVSMLSMIENGQREASFAVLKKLASGLGIPFDVLLAVSQPGEGTLSSSDKKVSSFVEALQSIEKLEKQIKHISKEFEVNRN